MAIAQSTLKVYQYPACSTCKNALKYLQLHKIPFEVIHIVEQAPTLSELKHVLKAVQERGGTLKNLFNTSGEVYRSMKLSEKLANMSESEALQLLAENGKLIKRPFVFSKSFSATGFQEAVWDENLRP